MRSYTWHQQLVSISCENLFIYLFISPSHDFQHKLRMNEWMNERTDGGGREGMNEWMNEWMNERTNERTDGRASERASEGGNEWMTEWTNERARERERERTSKWVREGVRVCQADFVGVWMNLSADIKLTSVSSNAVRLLITVHLLKLTKMVKICFDWNQCKSLHKQSLSLNRTGSQ